MNSFRLNDVCATNEQRPGGQGRGAAVSETTGNGGANGKEPNTSFSHASPGRSTGDVSVTHAYALAAELAQPVARGYLPPTEALAAMLAGTVRAERIGELAPYKAADVFRLQRHLFFQRLERLEVARDLATHRIKRLIAPMIAVRKRSNAILAEAHGVNGAASFPLTEDEVTEVVVGEMNQSLRRLRHVG